MIRWCQDLSNPHKSKDLTAGGHRDQSGQDIPGDLAPHFCRNVIVTASMTEHDSIAILIREYIPTKYMAKHMVLTYLDFRILFYSHWMTEPSGCFYFFPWVEPTGQEWMSTTKQYETANFDGSAMGAAWCSNTTGSYQPDQPDQPDLWRLHGSNRLGLPHVRLLGLGNSDSPWCVAGDVISKNCGNTFWEHPRTVVIRLGLRFPTHEVMEVFLTQRTEVAMTSAHSNGGTGRPGSKVSDTLLPMIRASSAEFRAGDFARLAQALPEERQTLTRSMVANCLENLGKYGKDRMRWLRWPETFMKQ